MNTPTTLKGYIFLVLIGVLVLPTLQSELNLFNLEPLKGSFEKAEEVKFDLDNWMDCEYQQNEEKWFNENFGFRSTCVRINNQLNYYLYKKVQVEDVVIGKLGYLFSKVYINSYLGKDFIGEEKIKTQLEKAKFLQDTLKKRNIDLVLLFAPNKARFYEEHLPDRISTPKGNSNYENYVNQCKLNQLNHIDFNQLFTQKRKLEMYELIPKFGTHWSVFAAAMAADTIIKYIEALRHTDLLNFDYRSTIETSDSLRSTDYDIGASLNLLFRFKTAKLAYPSIKIEQNEKKQRPRLLTIGDSFYWTLDETGMPANVFSEKKFIYYFQEIYPQPAEKDAIEKFNIKEELLNHDVVFLVATEHNLESFGWNFIELAYNSFKGIEDKDLLLKRSISIEIGKIRKDPQLFEKVKNATLSQNIPFDTAMYYEAKWQLEKAKGAN